MRAATKNKRASDKAAEWLKANGVSADAIAVAKETITQTKDEVSQEAEAVLSFLEKPTRFTILHCKRCGDAFGTNYRYNKYCTDTCRAKALKEIGLDWDPTADSKQRWGGEPPLTLPEASIQTLMAAGAYLKEHLMEHPSPAIPSQSQSEPHSAPPQAKAAAAFLSESLEYTALSDYPDSQTSEVHTSLDFEPLPLDDF